MLSYARAVSEIESFGVMPERPPSLEPMKRALAATRLDRLIDPKRVIVVAGTNGKGSVSAMLSELLESAGLRTGLYTSPHLIETTERIRVGGKDLTPEAFAQAYDAIRKTVLELKLTHFEVLTLMAAWVFFSGQAGAPVDIAIFEVGLGGIWDATNAVAHSHCIITALGLDHQNLLGNSLSEIARNKLGIVTAHATVVHAPWPPEALAPAREAETRTQATFIEAAPSAWETLAAADGPRFFALTKWGRAELKLPGARGAVNAAVALKAFETLGFDPSLQLHALAQVRWPGRMEKVQIAGANCPVYLSGDHNPQGVASLIELLPFYPRQHLHLLVGVGKDKDLDGILGPLSELPHASIHLTETPFRGRTIQDYGPWLARAASANADPLQALAHLFKTTSPHDLIIVTGSLYLVGAIRALC